MPRRPEAPCAMAAAKRERCSVDVFFGLLINAAIIGVIIAVMEARDFPGWGASLGCALAIGIADGVVSAFLPGVLSFLGIVAGAIVGAFVISWLCEMSFRRSMIAAGIYFGVRFAFWLVLGAIAGW